MKGKICAIYHGPHSFENSSEIKKNPVFTTVNLIKILSQKLIKLGTFTCHPTLQRIACNLLSNASTKPQNYTCWKFAELYVVLEGFSIT